MNAPHHHTWQWIPDPSGLYVGEECECGAHYDRDNPGRERCMIYANERGDRA